MLNRLVAATAAGGVLLSTAFSMAWAADAPAEIKLGTLYASAGRYASISMPVHYGLKLWIDQKNADGGVFVKAYNKKIPIKLVAYDDQSNTATASTLYNQLITQDNVNLLVADSGSVLTAPAVTIARDHKMFLFDQTGTGASFFSPDNKHIALMSDPVSTIWPKPIADFLTKDGPALGIKRTNFVAVLDELERRGLARRKAVAADRRSRALFLTPEGEAMATETRRLQDEHELRLAALLPEGERDRLIELLRALAQGIGAGADED